MGTPVAFAAEIGYLSTSGTATTSGHHLIGHRPNVATFPPGRPDFGYSAPKIPIILPYYPKIAGLFDHKGPPREHAPSDFVPLVTVEDGQEPSV